MLSRLGQTILGNWAEAEVVPVSRAQGIAWDLTRSGAVERTRTMPQTGFYNEGQILV